MACSLQVCRCTLESPHEAKFQVAVQFITNEQRDMIRPGRLPKSDPVDGLTLKSAPTLDGVLEITAHHAEPGRIEAPSGLVPVGAIRTLGIVIQFLN
jgi:hypothetical protein